LRIAALTPSTILRAALTTAVYAVFIFVLSATVIAIFPFVLVASPVLVRHGGV